MKIKIDMEKVYDRLRWDFIKDTLDDTKLLDNIICIIMLCVSTSTLQVMWNGGFTKEFKPSRGIRQEDPISSYLFILTMEKLGQVINFAISNGTWKPIFLGRGGSSLSHLLFVDNLVLFGEANLENAELCNHF